MSEDFKDIEAQPYKNYIYSYPHKKAYRYFEKPILLKELWKKSSLSNISLYIHIPFCMYKCGYCNLFSSTNFNQNRLSSYVDKLIEELWAVKDYLNIDENKSPFTSVIFGGGTPTVLEAKDLNRLLEAIKNILNINFKEVFFVVETSPRTLTEEKLLLLKEYHIDRLSMGIQSFKQDELKAIYRNEPIEVIEKALEMMVKLNVKIRNLDLIYGLPKQDLDSFRYSLNKLIEFRPEEIYLYPLYIREHTGLYINNKRDVSLMTNLYEFGRDFLKSKGYIQTSMRNFVREDMTSLLPQYGCQENEMIGLGCGARSYVDNVCYSRPYAVKQKNINKIIDDYIEEKSLNTAFYGYILDEDEMKRRYVLKSILNSSGLDIDLYNEKFNSSAVEEFKNLELLREQGFLIRKASKLYPTDKGLKVSDALGEIFISKTVEAKVSNFEEGKE